MVRRVGFGDSEKPPRRTQQKSSAPEPAGKGGPKGATRLIVGVFLLVWLVAWSAGIAFAIDEIMSQGLGAAETFLFIWVGVATIFWLLAVSMLWRIMTGRPLSNRKRRNWGVATKDHRGLNRGDWDHGAHD